jgi:hypothetical protein
MKLTRKYILLLLVGVIVSFLSCDLHTSDNGDLDGYWHLVKVDTLSTGKSYDMSERRVFWGVQVNLIEAVDHDNDSTHYGYLFYFEKSDLFLKLFNAHKHDRPNGDILVEDVSAISSLGVNSLEDKFRIITLNHREMVLEDELLRLSFKKH